MFSIGSNQSSKRWELLSIAGCEGLGLLITFFMAWSPARHQRRVIRGWSPRRLRHLQFLPTQRRDLQHLEGLVYIVVTDENPHGSSPRACRVGPPAPTGPTRRRRGAADE